MANSISVVDRDPTRRLPGRRALGSAIEGGKRVPKYLYLASYTTDAWKGMIETPPDRSSAVAALVESVGGSLDSVFWSTGDFDVVVIADLPDETAAAAVSVAVTSSGRVTNCRTHRLVTMEETAALLTAARAATGAYRQPGG